MPCLVGRRELTVGKRIIKYGRALRPGRLIGGHEAAQAEDARQDERREQKGEQQPLLSPAC